MAVETKRETTSSLSSGIRARQTEDPTKPLLSLLVDLRSTDTDMIFLTDNDTDVSVSVNIPFG